MMKLYLTPSAMPISKPVAATPPGHPVGEMLALRLPQKAQFIERPPLFVYDPHQTGLGGGLSHGWTLDRTPLAYRTVFDARSTGQRLIVDRDGSIVLDDLLTNETDCAARLGHFADRRSSLYHEDTDVYLKDDQYHSDRLDAPYIHVDEPVVSLLSVEPSNYGSWLFRVLPKLLLLEQLADRRAKVICWAPNDWQRELLSFFGVTEERLINVNLHVCYQFREIHVPIVLNPVAYMGEETMEFYRRGLEANGVHRKRERLIYISRQSRAAAANFVNVRHFIDEPRLVDMMRQAGFDIIEPETMSIADQVRLFASAAMVVGASGAGMFNTVFCAPGTGVIDIEAFPDWLYAHCNYFSSCGHAYGLAFGKIDETDHESWHKRWNIDVSGVVRRVQELRAVLGDS